MTYRVMQQGYKIEETPIIFMDRRVGKSKMSRKIVIEGFTYVLRERLSKKLYKREGGQSKYGIQEASSQEPELQRLPSVAKK
jgi:dolichol-phosphate mannosyltransferase